MNEQQSNRKKWEALPTREQNASPMDAGASVDARRMKPMDDRPDLLPIEPDLCELTGLSAQTLRSLINKGSLPGCRIGRRLYVPKAQFIEYIEKGEL